ncbi:MAG: hypothetical protein AAF609_14160 [Cyanobacteria bacterium P01_C01_bin.120]
MVKRRPIGNVLFLLTRSLPVEIWTIGLKLTDKPFHYRFPRLSRSGIFVMLTIASLLAHGLLLGLPWPAVEEATEPDEFLEPGEETVINVAILPAGQRAAQTSAAAPSAEEVTEPGQVDSESLSEPAPPPPPVVTPPPTKTPEPPRSETEPTASAEPPIEAGTGDLTTSESESPPTLADRLQDIAAYQYDGKKNLGNDAIGVAQQWAVSGQIYPAKAKLLELPYQLGTTCLNTPPLRGTLMVVVDAGGNFERGPEVISSTGYDILDEQAAAMVLAREYMLPEANESKAYSVDIAVQYPNECS